MVCGSDTDRRQDLLRGLVSECGPGFYCPLRPVCLGIWCHFSWTIANQKEKNKWSNRLAALGEKTKKSCSCDIISM